MKDNIWRKESPLIGICITALIAVILISLNIGRYSVSLVDIWNIITGNFGNDTLAFEKYTVFWNIRLPRTIFSVCVGCA